MRILFLIAFSIALISCKNKLDTEPQDLAIQSTEDGKVLLRLNPKKGDNVNMQMIVKGDGDLKGSPLSVETEMDFTMNTVDVKDSLYTYHMDVKAIRFKSGAPGLMMSYDSSADNEKGNMYDELFQPLLSNQATIVMNNMAEIKDLDWGEASSSAQQNNIELNGITLPLPEKPVGVGDSWTSKQTLNNGNFNMVFTVNKITQDKVYVGVVGSAQDKSEKAGISGTYIIDRKTSFTDSGEMKMVLSLGEIKMNMVMQYKAL